MQILQSMEEEALRIILDHYDGNENNFISCESEDFPNYMRNSFNDIFNRLKGAGFIASFNNYIHYFWIYMTPNGTTYFEDKENFLQMENSMFNKLPSNSRELLKEILEVDDPVELLDKKFDNCNQKEEDILRGIIGELCDLGLIKVFWADDIPEEINIFNSARTYFERESEYDKMQKNSNGTIVNIENFNANGSNVIMGDSINSTYNINNSIEKLEKDIEEKGGVDKEDLKEILDEVKDILENINDTRRIPRNKNLLQRISDHAAKHGWFYGAIVQLLGTGALTLLGN